MPSNSWEGIDGYYHIEGSPAYSRERMLYRYDREDGGGTIILRVPRGIGFYIEQGAATSGEPVTFTFSGIITGMERSMNHARREVTTECEMVVTNIAPATPPSFSSDTGPERLGQEIVAALINSNLPIEERLSIAKGMLDGAIYPEATFSPKPDTTPVAPSRRPQRVIED